MTSPSAPLVSPVNYVGTKRRLIAQIAPLIPAGDRIIDLFAGSMTVGLNTEHPQVWFNDTAEDVMSVGRMLATGSAEEITRQIEGVVAEYGLTDTFRHGFEHYGTTSSEGVSRANHEAYRRLRSDLNATEPGPRRSLLFYVVQVFSFNHQVRYNARGEFNMPGGKRDFHATLRARLALAVEALSRRDAVFTTADFGEVLAQAGPGDVVYADPPYLLGEAVYNTGWGEEQERALLDGLDAHARRGGAFALSNVAEHKGQRHDILLEWLDAHPEYVCHEIGATYANASYHLRDKTSRSREVLIVGQCSD